MMPGVDTETPAGVLQLQIVPTLCVLGSNPGAGPRLPVQPVRGRAHFA